MNSPLVMSHRSSELLSPCKEGSSETKCVKQERHIRASFKGRFQTPAHLSIIRRLIIYTSIIHLSVILDSHDWLIMFLFGLGQRSSSIIFMLTGVDRCRSKVITNRHYLNRLIILSLHGELATTVPRRQCQLQTWPTRTTPPDHARAHVHQSTETPTLTVWGNRTTRGEKEEEGGGQDSNMEEDGLESLLVRGPLRKLFRTLCTSSKT
ncbi:uncharacterized protein LOC128623054 [Ictalurus furcatus]|uniref:uncharacterized protein LOC128623054 n=1 Tax=Ictalurus furcatus TaxID=66913 RepID=UPI0023507DBB|nr:uncharacterized protein LOC128623054 [Ictalurus furcatus]